MSATVQIDEHTCLHCKGIFYTEKLEGVPKEITRPCFCPFCGISFNFTFPTKEQMT
jgi:hypothetical protein